jgi:putative transcriptional regulator
MPVVWNFKKWLVINRDIYRPSELQELIAQKAGVYISIQTLTGLMNETPSGIRCKTMLAICTALECKISDFFDIEGDEVKKQPKQRRAVGDVPPLYGQRSQNQQPKQQKNDDIYPEFRPLKGSEGDDG